MVLHIIVFNRQLNVLLHFNTTKGKETNIFVLIIALEFSRRILHEFR